jgi:predicted ArsR family transcriptional regulator
MPPTTNSPVRDGSSEHRILEALKRHGPKTAGELSALLGSGPVAMRAHLRHLLAAGLVTHEEEHRPLGRPVRRFRVTQAADGLFAHGYDLFAVALSEAVVAEWGEDALERLLGRWCARQERDLRAELPAGPRERLDALAAAQSRSGFMASIERAAGATVLVERNCPIAAVASRFPILCQHEAALHGRVLGREVALRSCCARGDEVCRFEIGPVSGDVRIDGREDGRSSISPRRHGGRNGSP